MGKATNQLPNTGKIYPGESAAAEQILRLADEYRKAAHQLQQFGRRSDPLSRAPFRLAAIHAIELYLNAFLLFRGQEPTQIRGLQHDLATRSEIATENGLQLRKRTAKHIQTMSWNREYLITRYGPEMTATTSQINRLTATLNEVATKVSAIVTPD